MLNRLGFHYGSIWSRLIACLVTANVVWYAIGGRVMEVMERIVYDALFAIQRSGFPELPAPFDTVLVYIMCLLPAFMQFDRPLMLIGSGLAVASGYAVLYLVVLFFAGGQLLPLAGPLFGLACSVAVLGAMAWSEERLRRKELGRMEAAKQRFTDMLVHDLKGRMSSIRISLTLLENELGGTNDATQPLFDTIRGSFGRMLLQINALLDIRKMQEGRLELHKQRVALAGVLRESLDEHAAVAKLCGVTIIEPDWSQGNALVDVDVEVFSRILANLLWNALRNAPRGSAVDVKMERMDKRVEVSLGNGGAAIPSMEQQDLFQPFVSHFHRFHTLPTPGAGLGLAFCKLAIEAHSGAIQLRSPRMPEGDGVRVTLTLPVAVL